MKKQYEIGEELEAKLYPLEAKLIKETTLSVFTKQEQEIMFAVYKAINGRVPAKNCTSCYASMKKSLLNWLKMYPKPLDLTSKAKEVKEGGPKAEEVKKTKKLRKPRKGKDGWTKIVQIENLGIEGKEVYLRVGDRELKGIHTASFHHDYKTDNDVYEWYFTDELENDARDWQGYPTHFKLVNDK